MKATDARYTLRDSSEVMAFLERLVAWGSTPANGWHAARQCLGWKLGAPVSPAADAGTGAVPVNAVGSPGASQRGEAASRSHSSVVQSWPSRDGLDAVLPTVWHLVSRSRCDPSETRVFDLRLLCTTIVASAAEQT